MSQHYTTIIGLEVHVQLLTQSKLFSPASTTFGAAPNTQVTPICLGMPGTLPVMNRRAFELGLRAAVALNCQINHFTKWDRKNYYYPDLPKGYQISQYDLPFSHDGHLTITDPETHEAVRVGIIRAHLEEDAGKSLHDEATGSADSKIDLNRAGVPLVEIVSEPDIRSPAQAAEYLREVRLLLRWIGASDCEMQEGSLRCDANVNLHIETEGGIIATPIVEVKNMNSIANVQRALEYEVARQYDLWQETKQKKGDVPKQTRGWDERQGVTRAQRQKEESSDYRYFPDPDLVPVVVTEQEVEQVQNDLGELPAMLRQRLQTDYGLLQEHAVALVNRGQAMANYYLELAAAVEDFKLANNWIQQDVSAVLNERSIEIEQYPVPVEQLAELLKKVKSKDLTTARAREVLSDMVASGRNAAESIEALGIEQVDQGELEALCQELIDANPRVVEDVRNGKDKAVGQLIGQAKKRNQNIDPGVFKETCLRLIRGE